MNSGPLREKAFGNVHTARAGAVAQKDLFERWRFFFFYKPGEANSSWLTAAFCTVCTACILNTWFISPSSISEFTSTSALEDFLFLFSSLCVRKTILPSQSRGHLRFKSGFQVSKAKSNLSLDELWLKLDTLLSLSHLV